MKTVFSAAMEYAGKAVDGVKSFQQESLGKNPKRMYITAGHFEGQDLLVAGRRPVKELEDAHIVGSDLSLGYLSESVNFGNPRFDGSNLTQFSVSEFSSFNITNMTKKTSFNETKLDSANFLLLIGKKNDGTILHGESLKEYFKEQDSAVVKRGRYDKPSAGFAVYSFSDLVESLDNLEQQNNEYAPGAEQRWLKDQIVIGAKYITTDRQMLGALPRNTEAPALEDILAFTECSKKLMEKYPFINTIFTPAEKDLVGHSFAQSASLVQGSDQHEKNASESALGIGLSPHSLAVDTQLGKEVEFSNSPREDKVISFDGALAGPNTKTSPHVAQVQKGRAAAVAASSQGR